MRGETAKGEAQSREDAGKAERKYTLQTVAEKKLKIL